MVERFRHDAFGQWNDANGRWVRYSDHEAELADLQRQLSEAVEQRDDYLNKALMADLDRQAAVERAEKAERRTSELEIEVNFHAVKKVEALEAEQRLQTKLQAAAAEVTRLREALEPFSDDLDNHPANIDDAWLDGTPYVKRSTLKVSHLRKARAALQREPKP